VLLSEALLAALAAGAAMAYGLHYLRPAVTSGTVLTQTLGVPLLGVVSVAFPERARAAMRRDVLGLSLAGGCLALAFVVAVFLSLHGFRFSLTAVKQMVGS
jgi:disulfide bond formation protein DsbB